LTNFLEIIGKIEKVLSERGVLLFRSGKTLTKREDSHPL